VCDDPWFRPVDIKLGPDGALYVADFYNRIIGHYEVPLTHPGRDRERGRIWRIVYRGTDGKSAEPKSPRADWSRATVDELVADLAHPNLTVRTLATNQLVERGEATGILSARRVLDGASAPTQRVHALWTLERLSALEDSALAHATADKEVAVRIHAMRILGERQTLTKSQYALVTAALKDRAPLVRRGAVEVLGRHPLDDNLRLLVEFVRRVNKSDSHLRHTARMALRDHLKTDNAWELVESQEWSENEQRVLADVAPGVTSQRAAAFLLRHLRRYPEPLVHRSRYIAHIARYGTVQAVAGELLSLLRGDRAATARQRLELWRAFQQGIQARGGSLSAEAREWGTQVARDLISSPYATDVAAGIDLAGTLRTAAIRPTMHALLMDRSAPEAVRLASMAALAAMDRIQAVPVLGSVLRDASAPLPLRERAANLLADANRPDAVALLFDALPTAPERVAVAIARGLANSASGSEQLLGVIASGKSSATLLQDSAVQMRVLRSGVPNAKDRVIELTRGLPTETQRLDKLLAQRRNTFASTATHASIGAAVYEKHCAACHQVGGNGSKIGPQLDAIAARGFDRLAEDILDPNRNVDPAFRTTTLSLLDGRLISGLILREEGHALVLADEEGKEVRVRKDEVEERQISPLSPMPSNFAERIPDADFHHLMAFLLQQK
jgi:putative heme-binding domain-containing protein